MMMIMMMMMMIFKQQPGFSHYIPGFAILIFSPFPASNLTLNSRMLQGLLQPCYNALGLIFHIYKLRVVKCINCKIPCRASILYFQDGFTCPLHFYLFKEKDFPFTLGDRESCYFLDRCNRLCRHTASI